MFYSSQIKINGRPISQQVHWQKRTDPLASPFTPSHLIIFNYPDLLGKQRVLLK